MFWNACLKRPFYSLGLTPDPWERSVYSLGLILERSFYSSGFILKRSFYSLVLILERSFYSLGLAWPGRIVWELAPQYFLERLFEASLLFLGPHSRPLGAFLLFLGPHSGAFLLFLRPGLTRSHCMGISATIFFGTLV